MKNIRHDQDFRLAYEVLSILRENADRVDDPERLAKVIIETKRAMRCYSHRNVEYERRIIKDNGMDGFISLERLPKDITDMEEAKQFFERFMTYEYQPSLYDCTGQAMTNWFKIFPRNGSFFAYHSVSFDV